MRSEQWDELTKGWWPFDKHRELDEACRLTAARMEHEGFEDLVEFFASLVARYTQWTWNLPASERHHHTFPFGLLIHGAETVERAVAVGRDTLLAFAPEWRMATVAFALYHDCGRLFDVEITDASAQVWNPLQESLLDFSGSGPTRYRWRPGRGLVTHEYRSQLLIPKLLPEEWEGEVRKPLDDAWYAYLHRGRLPLDVLGIYPYSVAGIVSWADQRSAQADRLRRQMASNAVPDPGVHAPVCYYSPKTETRAAFGGGR